MESANPFDEFGALASAERTYTRQHPSGITATGGPVLDLFGASVGTFESADRAASSAKLIAEQIGATLDRTWESASFSDATVPGLDVSLERFMVGTVKRKGSSYDYSWMVIASGPVVGVFYGLSSWYFTTLEVAFLASVFHSRAQGSDAADVGSLLPAPEDLTAGLSMSD